MLIKHSLSRNKNNFCSESNSGQEKSNFQQTSQSYATKGKNCLLSIVLLHYQLIFLLIISVINEFFYFFPYLYLN